MIIDYCLSYSLFLTLVNWYSPGTRPREELFSRPTWIVSASSPNWTVPSVKVNIKFTKRECGQIFRLIFLCRYQKKRFWVDASKLWFRGLGVACRCRTSFRRISLKISKKTAVLSCNLLALHCFYHLFFIRICKNIH